MSESEMFAGLADEISKIAPALSQPRETISAPGWREVAEAAREIELSRTTRQELIPAQGELWAVSSRSAAIGRVIAWRHLHLGDNDAIPVTEAPPPIMLDACVIWDGAVIAGVPTAAGDVRVFFSRADAVRYANEVARERNEKRMRMEEAAAALRTRSAGDDEPR